MTARTLGISFAILIASLVVSGTLLLIALDMFGADALTKAWRSIFPRQETSASLSGLEGAKDITFFASVPVEGTALSVETGVKFATLADLQARRQANRWCYMLLPSAGSLARRVELGAQTGFRAPTFTDLSIYPPPELSALGLNAARLHALARSHCRFVTPTSQASAFEGDRL